MQLTADQSLAVTEWVRAGANLAEVQRKLNSEFGLSLTYMDVRFLVLDLGIQLQDKAVPPPPKPVAPVAPPEETPPAMEAGDAAAGAFPPPPAGAGTARVELDRVTKPGSVVSGTVTFGDGVTAAWSLDQYGRLGLSGPRPGYTPAPEDVQAFQLELRRALERRGF